MSKLLESKTVMVTILALTAKVSQEVDKHLKTLQKSNERFEVEVRQGRGVYTIKWTVDGLRRYE